MSRSFPKLSAAVRDARLGLINFSQFHQKKVLKTIAAVGYQALIVAAYRTPLYSGQAALAWKLDVESNYKISSKNSYSPKFEKGLEGSGTEYNALYRAIRSQAVLDRRTVEGLLNLKYYQAQNWKTEPSLILQNTTYHSETWLDGDTKNWLREVNSSYYTSSDIMRHVRKSIKTSDMAKVEVY